MKSTDRILAKRYARAFDALSADTAQAQSACAALTQAAGCLRQAARYMQDPAVPSKDKIAFVQQLFGAQGVEVKFLCTLLRAKRYDLLDVCVQEVQHLLDVRQGVVRATVQTAYPLTAPQQKKTEEVLSQFTGKTVRADFTVQAHLLGGMCVRIEDTLIDGSIRRRFEKLREEIIK